MMAPDLKAIEKQARAAELKGEDIHRRTLKGLEVEDLEDRDAEDDARDGVIEKALTGE